MDPKTDFDQLARQADEAIAVADRRRSASRSRAVGRRGVSHTWTIVLLALPLLWAEVHFSWMEGLSDRAFPSSVVQQGQTELKAVLETARAAVESARATGGALPNALPAAALAALVRYERVGTSYRLSMTDGHSLATMDGDGSVDFQTLDR